MASDHRVSVELIRVSTNSRTSKVAGAIAGVIRQHKYAEIQAIGAGAVNQAVKALAVATGYLAEENISIWCQPLFTDISIDGQERTAMRFKVEPFEGDAADSA